MSLREVDDELEVNATLRTLDERPVKETGVTSSTVEVHDSEGGGEETVTIGEDWETPLETKIKELEILDRERTDEAIASEVGCHPITVKYTRHQTGQEFIETWRRESLDDLSPKARNLLAARADNPEQTQTEVVDGVDGSRPYLSNVLRANPHLFEELYRERHGIWGQDECEEEPEPEQESEPESEPEPEPEPDLDSLGGARGDEKAEDMLSKPQEEILWRYDMGAANVDTLAERADVDLRTVLLTLLTHRA